MTLDDKLKELGVNMAAVNGLRKLEYSDDSRIQAFIDKGLGEHLKWAVDLVEDTIHASKFSGDEDNKVFWISDRPTLLFMQSLRVAELLAGAGRVDVLQKWGEVFKSFYSERKYGVFLMESPTMLQKLFDAGLIDDFEAWAKEASTITSELGHSKYGYFLYRNSIPMFEALNEEGWRPYLKDWFKWAGTFANHFSCESDEGHPDEYIERTLGQALDTVKAFRENNALDMFGKFFRALAPPHWGKLGHRTEIFCDGKQLLEAYAGNDALEHFDYVLDAVEGTEQGGDEYFELFSLLEGGAEILEPLAQNGKLDRFREWLDTSYWHEMWAIKGDHHNQTRVKYHYFQAIMHDIPFEKITPICWAFSSGDYARPRVLQVIKSDMPDEEKGHRLNFYGRFLRQCSDSTVSDFFDIPLDKLMPIRGALYNFSAQDFDRQLIQQEIKSDMPDNEKGLRLDFYGRFLRKCSDSTVSDFLDYARERPASHLFGLGKGKMGYGMAEEVIQSVDNGENTFADLEEMVPLVEGSDINLEDYMIRELMRSSDRQATLGNLERALAIFESHPVVAPEPYLIAGLMGTSDNADFDNLEESLTMLESDTRIIPTEYLLSELLESPDKQATYNGWVSLMDTFADGNFDADDELHRSLEYTRFRKTVDNEKLKGHIKNHFSFEEYLKIFERHSEGEPFTDEAMFEIECVADEAIKLRDFILQASREAAKQGKTTLVVPNLSYGYLPVSPLISELEQEGIKFLVGAKVGSSESHKNKEYVDSRLFKGRRTRLMSEQPLVIVVDGTKNLVARKGKHHEARYPDSYTGYLNQVIAMNDALGYVNIDYSGQGKTPKDMDRLRQDPEFQRAVEVYKHVLKDRKGKKPYSFEFWNPAGLNLIIRNYHKKIKEVEPLDPSKMKGPAMVFCNAGLLHENIPDAIKERYPGLEHKPAHFDDSHKIIAFDFGYDSHGVKYLNRLEQEVKKAYARVTDTPFDVDYFGRPEIMRYIERHGNMPTVCSQS